MTANSEAYDLFLKASQTYYSERSSANNHNAIAGLERALALDPSFSSAALLLAFVHRNNFLLSTDAVTRLRHAQESKRWAETAQRLLPNGPCDSALAVYYSTFEPDNMRALALAESAAKALPNDAAALNTLGLALSSAGRSAEAAAAYRLAIELDPLFPFARQNLCRALVSLRRADDFAIAASDFGTIRGAAEARSVRDQGQFRLNGKIPGSLEGMTSLERIDWLQIGQRDAEALTAIDTALSAADIGDLTRWRILIQKCDSLRRLHRDADLAHTVREAKTWMDKLNAEPALDPSEQHRRVAATLARLGQADEAVAAGRRYVAARSSTNQVRARWDREIELAELYAYLARPRECVELLAKLLRVPSGLTVPMLKVDPRWEPIREDPVFKALLADPKNSAPL